MPILAGCAGISWETEKADPSFVDRTRILAMVIVVYSRNEIATGKRERYSYVQGKTVEGASDPFIEKWREKLLSAGFADAEIADGSELRAQTFCYAWDMAIPCRHRGYYLAHVNPPLQGKLRSLVESRRGGMQTADLVEIELRKTPTDDLVGVVVGIYRKYDDFRDCRVENLGDMGMFKYSPSGPPNGSWLECDGLEKEGWTQRIVRSAPSSNPNNPPPHKYVREWIKLPPSAK
ncbi:MAG TPA: hypothetical protein VJO54_11155 [Burkholderiales bacterium]|nr:hypothetical protein [Burkholderiales bacterium]